MIIKVCSSFVFLIFIVIFTSCNVNDDTKHNHDQADINLQNDLNRNSFAEYADKIIKQQPIGSSGKKIARGYIYNTNFNDEGILTVEILSDAYRHPDSVIAIQEMLELGINIHMVGYSEPICNAIAEKFNNFDVEVKKAGVTNWQQNPNRITAYINPYNDDQIAIFSEFLLKNDIDPFFVVIKPFFTQELIDYRETNTLNASKSLKNQISIDGDIEFSRTGIVMTIKNQTEWEYVYKPSGDIAYLNNGVWIPLEPLPGTGFEVGMWGLVVSSLQSGGINIHKEEWIEHFGELSPGRYMYYVPGWLVSNNSDNELTYKFDKTIYIAAEFSITSETPIANDLIPENEAITSPVNPDPIIANALANDYKIRWNFPTYTGDYTFEDCQDYLILFLSKTIGLTEHGKIKPVLEENDKNANHYIFSVQLFDEPESHEMVYCVNYNNLQIFNQQGDCLNPNGWPWPLPDRLLTDTEIDDRLWESADAAQWFFRYPKGDKWNHDANLYCYMTYGYGDGNEGEKHMGYKWIDAVTGEIEIIRFPEEMVGLEAIRPWQSDIYKNPDMIKAAFEMYYKILNEKIETYGIIPWEGIQMDCCWHLNDKGCYNLFPLPSAVLYAELIDFNGSGVPGLYIAYSDDFKDEKFFSVYYSIYQYQANTKTVELIYDWKDSHGSYGTAGLAIQQIARNEKGKIYLNNRGEGARWFENNYSVMQNGEWHVVFSSFWNRYNHSDIAGEEIYQYSINGIDLDIDDWSDFTDIIDEWVHEQKIVEWGTSYSAAMIDYTLSLLQG